MTQQSAAQSQQQTISPDLSSDFGDDASRAAGGTATAVKTRPRTAPPKVDRLPPWKVLLHNDALNEIGYVVETIIELTAVNPRQALLQTLTAHKSGLALLLVTHREKAEFLQEQFKSKRLTVSIEPDAC